jgi:hypothetical protein
MDMTTPQKIGLAALVVFVLSHLLPAYVPYHAMSGWQCHLMCWEELISGDLIDRFSGWWFYFSGFVITNLIFIGLAVALLKTRRHDRIRSVLSIVVCLHVVSWWVVNLVFPSEPSSIKVGYYVWLIAFALLVVAHLWKEPRGEST